MLVAGPEPFGVTAVDLVGLRVYWKADSTEFVQGLEVLCDRTMSRLCQAFLA
jgi:hypothetical protein